MFVHAAHYQSVVRYFLSLIEGGGLYLSRFRSYTSVSIYFFHCLQQGPLCLSVVLVLFVFYRAMISNPFFSFVLFLPVYTAYVVVLIPRICIVSSIPVQHFISITLFRLGLRTQYSTIEFFWIYIIFTQPSIS